MQRSAMKRAEMLGSLPSHFNAHHADNTLCHPTTMVSVVLDSFFPQYSRRTLRLATEPWLEETMLFGAPHRTNTPRPYDGLCQLAARRSIDSDAQPLSHRLVDLFAVHHRVGFACLPPQASTPTSLTSSNHSYAPLQPLQRRNALLVPPLPSANQRARKLSSRHQSAILIVRTQEVQGAVKHRLGVAAPDLVPDELQSGCVDY